MLRSFNVSKKAEKYEISYGNKTRVCFWKRQDKLLVYFLFVLFHMCSRSVLLPTVTSRTTVNSSTEAAKTLNPFSLRGDDSC